MDQPARHCDLRASEILLGDFLPERLANNGRAGGEDRGVLDFECTTNDNGGGYIQDNLQRATVVPVERGENFWCWSNFGAATALTLNESDEFNMISYNIHHMPKIVDIPVDNPQPRVKVPAITIGDSKFVFCTVPKSDSEPWIVDKDNTCLAADPSCP